jgi:hypothetical protein
MVLKQLEHAICASIRSENAPGDITSVCFGSISRVDPVCSCQEEVTIRILVG